MLSSVAVFSYGAAALAFAVLCVLQLSVWRSRAHAAALAVAALATALWAGLNAWEAAYASASSQWNDALDIGRNAAWSVVLLSLLGFFQRAHGWQALRHDRLLRLVAGFYALLLGGEALANWAPGLLAALGGMLPLVMLRAGAAVLGMILVEQLYRNKPLHERWALKYACLGIGGMYAYDFYLYSDTMLFRQVNADIWAARGFVQALTMPLIALAVSRSKVWSSELSVSRRVLFHSAALAGSAAYLLVMSSAGYYLRFFGGSWGSVMQVAFLFGATVLLAGVLFSGAFRAWLKVFISKHFYSYNYDYREEWMGFTACCRPTAPTWPSAPSRPWPGWWKARAARCGCGASPASASRWRNGICRP